MASDLCVVFPGESVDGGMAGETTSSAAEATTLCGARFEASASASLVVRSVPRLTRSGTRPAIVTSYRLHTYRLAQSPHSCRTIAELAILGASPVSDRRLCTLPAIEPSAEAQAKA
jgi:hypothetical protein